MCSEVYKQLIARYSIWSPKFKSAIIAEAPSYLMFINFTECILNIAKLQHQLSELGQILSKNTQEMLKKSQHCLFLEQQLNTATEEYINSDKETLLSIQASMIDLHQIQQKHNEQRRPIINNVALVNTLKAFAKINADFEMNNERKNEILLENYQTDQSNNCGCFILPNF